ncbi:MAG: carbohydrate-binding family 9-like protein, partial [Planctomycetaceae bacterium]|nr:carbohydrate-binding family 9-like protein [Planctomycetaceae bacterium]
LVGDARDIVVDGQLDDAYWQNCPTAATGRLRELQTGGIPTFGTSFQAGWQGNQLYFAIRCDEHPGEPLNNTATRDDDQAIWYGDAIELEIETEMHSYYQIAISPSGVVVDLDRGIPKGQWFGWDSQAEVATHVSDDHWVAEIRIPVSQDENDPLHQVIGSKPTQSLPWHINICRQRIRDDGQELSALSPTGTAGFHEPLKFAHFYDGRSHRFDADPTVTDFAIRFREAERERQASLCLKLTDTKVSDFQRSAALELAARLDPEHAETLITRIPIDAVRKTARMQFLLANRDPAALIAEFDTEDLSTWPFWKRGSGHYLRGRAHYLLKSGAAAERDLTTALEFTGDPRTRDETRLTTAQNREFHLQDDSAAFAAYQAVVEGRSRIGSANEFAALQGMARILTRRGEFDEALRVLNRADLSNLKGTWRDNILKSIEAVQAARQ